jgi:molybdopterin converting factor small subunit
LSQQTEAKVPLAVRIRLFGELARYSGGRGYSFHWPLAPGETIADLIAAIGIPAAEVWMVALNGVKTGVATEPVPGDEVMIFSPVGGG